MANYKVLYPVFITDINGITTATENSIWITSPTLLATASITVPVNLSVAATTTSTLVSTTYTLLQHWIGTNASWSVGQGGKNGQIPFTFTTWPATGHTATTSLDMSTITGPPSSTSAFTASRGGSTSTGSTTSSAGPGPTSSEASHHDRITSGAAAGIGIGSAAAGAIIALLLAFCLMRRKSSASKRYDPHDVRSSPSDESPSGFEKTPAIMMSSLPRKGDDSVVPLLPPPTQTSELVKMFSTLSTMIQNHAYSYFIEGPKVNVSSAHSINSEHVNVILGPGAPVETKMVLDLLNSPQRVVAVRIILGWGIMSNIQPRSDSDSTLLPLEFAECLRTFSEDASTDSTLVSRWRHLTGTILAPTYGSKPTDAKMLNRSNFTHLVDMLDEVLAPLGTSSETSSRRSNLEQIVKLGAQSGYVLLTQPTGWKFDWQNVQAKSGNALVVFPDLIQVEDDMGRALNPPRSYNTIQVVRTA